MQKGAFKLPLLKWFHNAALAKFIWLKRLSKDEFECDTQTHISMTSTAGLH